MRVLAETPLYGTRVARDDKAPHPPVSIVEVDGTDVVAHRGVGRRPNAPAWEESPPPASRSPITARGPFAPNAPSAPFADVAAVVAGMREATSRDAVLELLLVGARTIARKVALFVVKRHELVGWTCTPEFGDKAALREVHLRLDLPSLLVRALTGGTHLGHMLKNAAHAPVLDVMQGAPGEVAVTGVRVEGRPAIVILAGELGDTMIATRRLDELARVAGEALASIVRHKAKV